MLLRLHWNSTNRHHRSSSLLYKTTEIFPSRQQTREIDGQINIHSFSRAIYTLGMFSYDSCTPVSRELRIDSLICGYESFKKWSLNHYLNSSLELFMLPQECFSFEQWCSKFGTGVKHSFAIPNPPDNLRISNEKHTTEFATLETRWELGRVDFRKDFWDC